jgi:hypothetical protein
MSAALIAKLLEAGTPAELVAEVAMELARAQAAVETTERRRDKDRERKRALRNSTESEEGAEQGSLEVSPLASPFPKPSKSAPYNPPKIMAEKQEAIATCLRRAFPPPDGVSDEQWAAFRKQRKKALNDRSYTLLVNKLIHLATEGHDPGLLIDLAIERGWETVFAPRTFGNERPPDTKLKITDPVKLAENKRGVAAIYERMGRTTEADELRREAESLEQRAAA